MGQKGLKHFRYLHCRYSTGGTREKDSASRTRRSAGGSSF